MGVALGKIALSLLMRVLTESFVARLTVYCLKELSESTENKLDDKIVGAVSDALGVKLDQ